MSVTYFIALKHIVGRKRQSVIAILSVALAILVMTVALGVSSGLDNQMIQSMLTFMPHVKVTNSTMTIKDYEAKKAEIEAIPGVKGAIPNYSSQGIIKFSGHLGSFVSGVIMEGVPEKEANHELNIKDKLVKGTLGFDKLSSVVIGKELANQIGAHVGDSIKVVSPEDKTLYLTVTGIFYSGYYDFDSKLIIMPLKTLQILSDSGDAVTSIDVMLDNAYSAPKLAPIIHKKTGFYTQTWGEINHNLLYALSLERTVMILVMSLILIVSGFVVAVVLSTVVKEKTRDIGILRAYGFSEKKIRAIFLIEGILLGIVGLIIGTIVSLGVLYILKNYSLPFITQAYYMTKLPVKLTLSDYMMTIGETFVIIIIATLLPARKASKLKPVEALKYE